MENRDTFGDMRENPVRDIDQDMTIKHRLILRSIATHFTICMKVTKFSNNSKISAASDTFKSVLDDDVYTHRYLMANLYDILKETTCVHNNL